MPAWVAAWLLVLAGPAFATDVAFWSTYQPDADDKASTYFLLGREAAEWTSQIPAQALETIGQPRRGAGKLGPALVLDGGSGLRFVPRDLFTGGRVSIEAWVKLDAYPLRSGFVVQRGPLGDPRAPLPGRPPESSGFALSIDWTGALILDTVNVAQGRAVRLASERGVVPLNQWVHVAGVAGRGRKLFVNGSLVADAASDPAGDLDAQWQTERQAAPLIVGNSLWGDSGLTGMLEQVRVHRNVFGFWPAPVDDWTDPDIRRTLIQGPPHFLAEHEPAVAAGLDGSPLVTGRGGARVDLGAGQFLPGVRGQAFAGPITVTAPALFRSEEGSLEFWMRPRGINSLSDRNRTFLAEPFVFYLLNGDKHDPTLFFRNQLGQSIFLTVPVEMHPARWYHWVITWRGEDIRVYLDGKLAGRALGQLLAPFGFQRNDRFQFNPYETISLIDEIRVYAKALLPIEAANAHARYRAPERLQAGVTLPAADLDAEFLPDERALHYRLTPLQPEDAFAEVEFTITDSQGREVLRETKPWSRTGALTKIPAQADSQCLLAASVTTRAGATLAGGSFSYLDRHFPWQDKPLGLPFTIDPPFEAVRVDQENVSVVGRVMKFNRFGLWDQVRSAGQDLLAAPMALHFETPAGPGRWDEAHLDPIQSTPLQARCQARCRSGPLALSLASTVDIDGCTRLTVTLAPGPNPGVVRKLWLEIPLRDDQAPLLHTIGDGLRNNYSGSVPPGAGSIWNGSKVWRGEAWRNDFVPYVWLGSPNRGLAVFAENDRGWVTEKNLSHQPTHELIRENGVLRLRLHLINKPIQLTEARTLVVGLQASPTKPMPDDWRRRQPHAPGGLPDVPFGGLQCASQGPYADDWTIVDRILDPRRGLRFDARWLSDYVRLRQPPRVHGQFDWADYVRMFAGRSADAGLRHPLAVYHEEMRAATGRPEWIVFQDAWKTQDGFTFRASGNGFDLRGGLRAISPIAFVNFAPSYADFACHMANQWLDRGVSLYWDNTFLSPSYNTRRSAAYRAEDGQIQPALILWDARDYYRRIWTLLQQHRRTTREPLEWTLHMTNALVLPLHTWGTVQLDIELDADRTFASDWLLAESTGRQVGNIPLVHNNISGTFHRDLTALPMPRQQRIEWGLRAVHEIQRTGPMEAWFTDFGYGTVDVEVLNDWDDRPVLGTAPPVRWIALRRPRTGEWLIVLVNWSRDPLTATVELPPLRPGLVIRDLESGETLGDSALRKLTLPLPGLWDHRVLRIGP